MSWLHKLSDKLNALVEQFLWAALAVMSVVVFAQVIFRIVKGSLPWSEEFARYVMIYLVYLGTSVGVKRGSLIAVEAFSTLLPKKLRKAVDILALLLSMVFFIILVVYGTKIVRTTFIQTSPAMMVRMGYIYAAIVIGGILMLIHGLSNLAKLLFAKSEEA